MKHLLLAFYRLLSASIVVVALVSQYRAGLGIVDYNSYHFFTYFTVDSALLAVGMFFITSQYLLTGKRAGRFDFLRGAAALYMLMTATLYLLFLPEIIPIVVRSVPWVNVVLHYFFPVVVVIDWLIDAPSPLISFRQALPWLIFPVAYLNFIIMYGVLTGWYPYPILDPAAMTLPKFLIIQVIMCLIMVVFTWLLVRIVARRRGNF